MKLCRVWIIILSLICIIFLWSFAPEWLLNAPAENYKKWYPKVGILIYLFLHYFVYVYFGICVFILLLELLKHSRLIIFLKNIRLAGRKLWSLVTLNEMNFPPAYHRIFGSWVLYFVLSLMLFVVKIYTTKGLNDDIRISDGIEIDYQSVAINFAEYGVFPYSGFIGDISYYHLDTTNLGFANTAYVKALSEFPPVINVVKTPGFPAFIGMIYIIWGTSPLGIRAVNIFMVCFMSVFMTYMGYCLLGKIGGLLGLVAGIIYANNSWELCYYVSPDILLSFLIYLLFLVTMKSEATHTKTCSIATGLLFAFMLLIKGTCIFILVLYFGYLGFNALFKKELKELAITSTVFLSIILSWSVYANMIYRQAKPERDIWYQTFSQTIDTSSIEKHQAGSILDDSLAISNLVKYLYSMYAYGEEPILICKQTNFVFSSITPLCLHSELNAIDGDIHEEWKFIPTLYYNQNDADKPMLIRIALFYINNPQYIYSIMKAKFLLANSLPYTFYKISIWMLGLLTIRVFGILANCRLISQLVILVFLFIGVCFPFSVTMPIFLLLGLIFQALYVFVDALKISPFMLAVFSGHLLMTIIFFAPNRFVDINSPICVFFAFILGYSVLKLFLAKSLLPLFRI